VLRSFFRTKKHRLYAVLFFISCLVCAFDVFASISVDANLFTLLYKEWYIYFITGFKFHLLGYVRCRISFHTWGSFCDFQNHFWWHNDGHWFVLKIHHIHIFTFFNEITNCSNRIF